MNKNARELAFKKDVKHRLMTETISNIHYFNTGKAPGASKLFEELHTDKIAGIDYYYTHVFDTGIKKEYDDALYAAIHLMLSKSNVPHLIMGHYVNRLINEKNRMENEWGFWVRKYPDIHGSMHCNEEGNYLVGQEVIKHIKKYNLL